MFHVSLPISRTDLFPADDFTDAEDTSNCKSDLGYYSNRGDNVALNFQTSVGVELYADLGLDIVGFKFDTDKLPIFVSVDCSIELLSETHVADECSLF